MLDIPWWASINANARYVELARILMFIGYTLVKTQYNLLDFDWTQLQQFELNDWSDTKLLLPTEAYHRIT